MPDSLIARDAINLDSERMSEIEAQYEIESLDTLHAERRQIFLPTSHKGEDYPYYRVMYGPGDRSDKERKVILERLKLRFHAPRPEDPPLPPKATDSAVDAWAHGHPEYLSFLKQSMEEAQVYEWLSLKVREVEDRIENRRSMMYARAAELKV